MLGPQEPRVSVQQPVRERRDSRTPLSAAGDGQEQKTVLMLTMREFLTDIMEPSVCVCGWACVRARSINFYRLKVRTFLSLKGQSCCEIPER